MQDVNRRLNEFHARETQAFQRKELANDEEESLFSKLTSESLIEARSKFGSKETEGSKKRDKKRRSRRRVDGVFR